MTQAYDPLADEKTNGMILVFQKVELNQATLTVTASDADIPLGSSDACDLGQFFDDMNAMDAKEEYVHDSAVKILTDEKEQMCVVHLRLTYHPSQKDRREALYEELNKASQKKASAVQALRQSALEASRSAVTKSPTVKPGFLNKGSAKKEEVSKWQELYNRYLGPQSLLRQVVPVAKNYVIFVVAIGWMHFQGQTLALPPPV